MFTPKDFDKSQVGNYTKLTEGQNRIRILKEPVTGYEYWKDVNGNIVPKNEMAGQGGKPVRAKDYSEWEMQERSAMKGFAAMVIWNYQVEKIQILQIKQVGIIASLDALAMSKAWGDITSFDIVITKTKTGPNSTDVEYSVMPEPKEDLDKKILDAYNKVNINLEALFTGEDPFSSIGLSSEEMDKIAEDLDA